MVDAAMAILPRVAVLGGGTERVRLPFLDKGSARAPAAASARFRGMSSARMWGWSLFWAIGLLRCLPRVAEGAWEVLDAQLHGCVGCLERLDGHFRLPVASHVDVRASLPRSELHQR